jgi:hypothetical protein
MKEREEMPGRVIGEQVIGERVIEERIRDAFGAAAATVTARDLPGLPTPPGRSWVTRRLVGWAPQARVHAVVPAIAAVCVAMIVVTATLIVPRMLAGPPDGGTATGLAGAPRFFAGLTGRPQDNALNIYRSATGRVVGSVPAPRPDREFEAVARLGSDRTYVAAAVTSSRACTTQLYRFTVGPGGRPSGLTPLSVPQITGMVMELVGSADGNVLAYKVGGLCAPHQLTGVIHLATRQITTWSYGMGGLRPPVDGDLSLTADGSVLGFMAGSPYDNPYGLTNVWVLPTDAPGGPLTRHARKVLHLHTGVFRVLLSNTGSQMYVETAAAPRGGAVILSLYSTATGTRIRLLGRIGPGGLNRAEVSVTPDAAGKHLLIYGYFHPGHLAEMSLSTGHVIPVTTAQPPVMDGAQTSAAW